MPGGARALRRRKWFNRLKLWIMRIMAMDAEQILLVAVPVTGAFPVDANFPVAEFVTMALTAQSV